MLFALTKSQDTRFDPRSKNMHMTCASEILGQGGDRVETAFVGESGNGHLAHAFAFRFANFV
jgi:hypothetical protein